MARYSSLSIVLAMVVFYQSDKGFLGVDRVALDIGIKGQPIRQQNIEITVGE